MGFFSNLFKKKGEKLSQGEIDEIEQKVELTEDKFAGERQIYSDLKKPSKPAVKKPANVPVMAKPVKQEVKPVKTKVYPTGAKPVKKKAKKAAKAKAKKSSKKKSRK